MSLNNLDASPNVGSVWLNSLEYEQAKLHQEVQAQLATIYEELGDLSKGKEMGISVGLGIVPCVMKQLSQKTLDDKINVWHVVWNVYQIEFPVIQGPKNQRFLTPESPNVHLLISLFWGAQVAGPADIYFSSEKIKNLDEKKSVLYQVRNKLTDLAQNWVKLFHAHERQTPSSELREAVRIMTRDLVKISSHGPAENIDLREWNFERIEHDLAGYATALLKQKRCSFPMQNINEICVNLRKQLEVIQKDGYIARKKCAEWNRAGSLWENELLKHQKTVTTLMKKEEKIAKLYACKLQAQEKGEMVLGQVLKQARQKETAIKKFLTKANQIAIWSFPSKKYSILRCGGGLFLGSPMFMLYAQAVGGGDLFFRMGLRYFSQGVVPWKSPKKRDLERVFSKTEVRFCIVSAYRFYSDKVLQGAFSCKIYFLLKKKENRRLLEGMHARVPSVKYLMVDLVERKSSSLGRSFWGMSDRYVVLSQILSKLGPQEVFWTIPEHHQRQDDLMTHLFYDVKDALAEGVATSKTPAEEVAGKGLWGCIDPFRDLFGKKDPSISFASCKR